MTEAITDVSHNYLLWIPLLPFIGFLLNGLIGKRMGIGFVSFIGCAMPLLAFAVAWHAFGQIRQLGDGGLLHAYFFDWIHVAGGDVPTFTAKFALLFDPLAAIMCLVITGVGSLIHLYSTGYMKGDPAYWRYFSYLNLFTTFMLILVLADNLLLMFVGWEGVGLCSYLLIGFWYQDSANADAGKKAFIVNRIGDFAFLIGMFVIWQYFGSLDTRALGDEGKLAELTGATLNLFTTDNSFLQMGVLTAITLLLFIGATGKSAQIPLYVWLPDAMAGPTPVSALIHAATMVTSGVYLCCRLAPMFTQALDSVGLQLATLLEKTPDALRAGAELNVEWSWAFTTPGIIAGIGACTALFAALIALTQTDIKKVLAYSTVSQLGYMFFAVGVGAYAAAFFHLVTHAFFKALLFLGSGSVIHAMHHEQDMRKMGGLRHRLPTTHLMFIVGTLAIAGVPPLAGFFSKDEILFEGMHHAHGFLGWTFWGMAFLTAGLTAFYMLRMVALTFWGESHVDRDLEPHVHEPGGWMQFALSVLAILTIVGGFLSVPHFLGGHQWLGNFIGLAPELTEAQHEALKATEWTSLILSVLAGAAGLVAAWYLYGPAKHVLQSFAEGRGKRWARWSYDKFYVDELYDFLFVKPFEGISYVLWVVVDRVMIDGILVNGSALLTRTIGESFRRMQSGFVPAYLVTFSCGALVLMAILLALLKATG